jgi:CHAT domain-containing protein
VLIDCALAYAQLQQQELSLSLFQRAITSENQWLTNVISINDTEQRMKDLEQRQYQLEFLLSMTQQYFPNDNQVIEKTFQAVLSRKAQAANAEANFNKALRNQPTLAPDIKEYQACQKEIATLAYAIGDRQHLKIRLNTLLEQRRDLEKKLARSIPEIELFQKAIDQPTLSHILPANSFLLEFVLYRNYDFTNREWQNAHYLAFIVEQNKAGVTMLDCGLAELLDQAIEKFRFVQANNNFDGQNSDLTDALENNANQAQSPTIENPVLTVFLDQLLPHLPTTGTCFLAPDSHLHILPFHILKTPDGEYLGDRYQIHYLNTARDLFRRQIKPSINPPLIIADPDYDGNSLLPFPQVQNNTLTNPKTERQISDGVAEKPFKPLSINKILGEQVAAAYQVPCYSGADATVDRFRQADSPQLLMIATHGFSSPPQTLLEMLRRCLIDQEEKIISERQKEITSELRDFWQKKAEQGNQGGQRILAIIDRYGIRPQTTDILQTPTVGDPMLRCGFALAGANIWRFKGVESPQFGKGIIFAQDVMQCNLWGTELAIIATCVSGMGEVKSSEGVFGLRRALAIAGAKYVITSLWNIPTKPSALLMEKFFEFYKSGLPPAVAVSSAQKYVRNVTLGALKKTRLGEEVIAELKEGYMQISDDTPNDLQPLSHPYFWGAWICQG